MLERAGWLFGEGRYARRDLLASATFGVGSVALASLLRDEQLLAAPAKPDLERKAFDTLPKQPHTPAKATAMISLFMQGGPSSIDLFDPKPELVKLDGQQLTPFLQRPCHGLAPAFGGG